MTHLQWYSMIFSMLMLFVNGSYLSVVSDWRRESELSISQNIVTTDSRFFQFPNKFEVNSYQRLSPTLEAANNDLHRLAVKNGYDDKWRSAKEVRWVIPVDQPGQNRSRLMSIAEEISKDKILKLYEEHKTNIHGALYLTKIRRGVVHPTGFVNSYCGYYVGVDGCETRWRIGEGWRNVCTKEFQLNKLSWDTYWTTPPQRDYYMNTLHNCTVEHSGMEKFNVFNLTTLFKPQYYKRVFVITALWDYNYNHFVTDSLTRLIRNIRFLRANKDIMIHIRNFEEYDFMIRDTATKASAVRMRNKLLTLLGIDLKRVVFGVVVADEVFVPRHMRCAYALSNPLEIRLLKRELLNAAIDKATKTNPMMLVVPDRKILLIQQRYTPWGSGDRSWNNNTMNDIVQAFSKVYIDHKIVTISSIDTSHDSYCLECDILKYAKADVLVGAHGAGLTNLMFMTPGSLVVEIAGHVQDVSMPWCGYYGPTSAIFGHHHYIHGYDHEIEPMNELAAATQTFKFYQHILKNKNNEL